jgi:glycosyltransferase involved in cell wall biosynthesis
LLLNTHKINLKLTTKFLLKLKIIYINYLNNENYTWAVQTKNVADLLKIKLATQKSNVIICPIFSIDFFKNCNIGLEHNYLNYVYVADGSIQKNHINLLKAWELFTENFKNENLTLHLTLDVNIYHDIIEEVNILKMKGIKVVNHGLCSLNKIKELYETCNYLVYPSLAESFGLPLLEAASSRCKVISSDLPYVYEVVQPSLVFDPNNIESIVNTLSLSLDYKKISTSILKVENKINLLFNSNLYV